MMTITLHPLVVFALALSVPISLVALADVFLLHGQIGVKLSAMVGLR